MMTKCEFKKGIFIQRDCANPANHTCAECYTGVCRSHCRSVDDKRGDGKVVLCHSCYLKRENISEDEARQRYLESDAEFMLWYSSFREEHTVSRDDMLFDSSDYQGFDSQYVDEQAYLEDDGDFFDS